MPLEWGSLGFVWPSHKHDKTETGTGRLTMLMPARMVLDLRMSRWRGGRVLSESEMSHDPGGESGSCSGRGDVFEVERLDLIMVERTGSGVQEGMSRLYGTNGYRDECRWLNVVWQINN